MKKPQKYVVWNNIDNIATHPGAFDTKEQAEQFSKEFVMRFQGQGYYRDNNWNKISLEELPNYLEIIDEKDFLKQFTKNESNKMPN
jgi:hypothetical protein